MAKNTSTCFSPVFHLLFTCVSSLFEKLFFALCPVPVLKLLCCAFLKNCFSLCLAPVLKHLFSVPSFLKTFFFALVSCAGLKIPGRRFVEFYAHLPRPRRVPRPLGVGNVWWWQRAIRRPASGLPRGGSNASFLDLPRVRQQLALARAAATSPAERSPGRPDSGGGGVDVCGVLHRQWLAAVG